MKSQLSATISPVGAPLGQLGVDGGSGAMFDRIARRYDSLNRVLTFGIDQHWRKRAVAELQIGVASRVLDLATGTADLAIMLAQSRADCAVVGLDVSAGMLAVGQEKVDRLGLTDRVTLRDGDAQKLPFQDASFNAISMAFGIRNVPDRAAALREMARVVRPQGRVVILEASEPTGGILGPFARFYLHAVVPRIGALLSGSPNEYRYLQESIADFPPPEQFAQKMRDAGLEVVEVIPLMFGVAHLYIATTDSTALAKAHAA